MWDCNSTVTFSIALAECSEGSRPLDVAVDGDVIDVLYAFNDVGAFFRAFLSGIEGIFAIVTEAANTVMVAVAVEPSHMAIDPIADEGIGFLRGDIALCCVNTWGWDIWSFSILGDGM